MTLREHELGRHDVLAEGPDVLVRGYRRLYLDGRVVNPVDVLDHDDRVGLGRHGIAGVHPEDLVADVEALRHRLRRADRVAGADCYAVHRGGVVVGRRAARPHGSGGHSAPRVVDGDSLGGRIADGVRRSKGRIVAAAGFLQGEVFEVVFALIAGWWHSLTGTAIGLFRESSN